MKGSNLRCCQARSQNKGLSEYHRRASRLWTDPSPSRGREAGRCQPEPAGKGQTWPQDNIPYQTATSVSVANQVFLGSWTLDIHQEGCSQRSAPQKRYTAHLRCSCALRKPSGWDWGGDKTHHIWGVCTQQIPGRLSCSDLGKAQNAGHKTKPQLSLCLCGVPKNLNLSSVDLGSARNSGPSQESSLAEQPGA